MRKVKFDGKPDQAVLKDREDKSGGDRFIKKY
jgi:hypothetical protein